MVISTARIGEGLLSLRFPRTRLHAASAPVGVQARLGSVRQLRSRLWAMGAVLPRTNIHAATSHADHFVMECLLKRLTV